MTEVQEVKNKYGLRQKSTGELVGFEVSSNAGQDFCGENQYYLEIGSKKIWLVEDPELAEFVRLNSTEWYNASYNTPTNEIDPNDLEVIEINVSVDVKPVSVELISVYDFFEACYAEDDPEHWKNMQGYIEKDAGTKSAVKYGWHDYVSARKRGKFNK